MKYIYILFLTLILINCTDEFSINDIASTEALPSYVAFNPDGTTAVINPVNISEDSDPEDINVEIIANNQSDVTVNYTLSGTAVFGTDYTINGASANGGILTIEHKNSTDPDDLLADNADITITPLIDGLADGDKTVIITLVSASNEDGDTIAIGRGGTNALTTQTINIADID